VFKLNCYCLWCHVLDSCKNCLRLKNKTKGKKSTLNVMCILVVIAMLNYCMLYCICYIATHTHWHSLQQKVLFIFLRYWKVQIALYLRRYNQVHHCSTFRHLDTCWCWCHSIQVEKSNRKLQFGQQNKKVEMEGGFRHLVREVVCILQKHYVVLLNIFTLLKFDG